MLKIRSSVEVNNFNYKSILELFDYTQFKKPYNTMKISWYHKIKLKLNLFNNDMNEPVDKCPTTIKAIFIVLAVFFLSLTISMPFPLFGNFLSSISIISLLTVIFLDIVPHDNSTGNVCKTLTNYFNGNSNMEANFNLLKEKLLSPQGKAILAKDINNDDYGYIVKDIIENLISNNDMKLLDNILQLGKIQQELKNKKKIEEVKAKNFQNDDLLEALKNHVT